MRRTRWTLLALILVTPALPAAGQKRRPGTLIQAGRRVRYVYTDHEALLLMPPELVAAPFVRSASWSPDSRYVLAQCEYGRVTSLVTPPDGGEVGLVLWRAK